MVVALFTTLASGAAETPAPAPTGQRAAAAITATPTQHAEQAAPQREPLLRDAEQALRHGEVARATTLLDRAGQLGHAADTEMLQVRTMMQAGNYRHAVGFLAHTAGEHQESTDPVALYVALQVIVAPSPALLTRRWRAPSPAPRRAENDGVTVPRARIVRGPRALCHWSG